MPTKLDTVLGQLKVIPVLVITLFAEQKEGMEQPQPQGPGVDKSPPPLNFPHVFINKALS